MIRKVHLIRPKNLGCNNFLQCAGLKGYVCTLGTHDIEKKKSDIVIFCFAAIHIAT